MLDPATTIVIPTRARPVQLTACLDSLVNLDHDHDGFEVIVVDDGGPDSLEPVVDRFRHHLTLRLIVRPHGGPAAARNAGATAARGRFLIFVDDDCTVAPGWLSVLEHELERDGNQLIGGRVVNALSENPYSTASQLIATHAYEYYRGGRSRETFFTTNNFALSAEMFRALGGFETSIPGRTAEDKEFCDRWRARNLQMTFAPGAVVYHAHNLRLLTFIRQHYNYGRGILTFRVTRRLRRRTPLIPEPLSFYRDLILTPMHDPNLPRSWMYVPLMVVSQCATAAGALKALLTERTASTRRAPRALAHLRQPPDSVAPLDAANND